MTSALKRISLGLVLSLTGAGAPALGGDSDRDALTDLAREIAALAPLLERAAVRAAPAVRASRYGCLRADLQQVRAGILTHVAGPRPVPREPDGLCLDYYGQTSQPGLALTGGEAAVLARFDHALAALTPLVDAAERQAQDHERVRFRFEWLRADLARVRAGIARVLAAPRTVPRAFEPLTGDHRRPGEPGAPAPRVVERRGAGETDGAIQPVAGAR